MLADWLKLFSWHVSGLQKVPQPEGLEGEWRRGSAATPGVVGSARIAPRMGPHGPAWGARMIWTPVGWTELWRGKTLPEINGSGLRKFGEDHSQSESAWAFHPDCLMSAAPAVVLRRSIDRIPGRVLAAVDRTRDSPALSRFRSAPPLTIAGVTTMLCFRRWSFRASFRPAAPPARRGRGPPIRSG
jgi:hypothetical protein